jgi:hypothetical protein
VVEPELLGTALAASLAATDVPSIVIGAGQQFDLSSLADLGDGPAPPSRVRVFLESD